MWAPTNLTKEEIVQRALSVEDVPLALLIRVERRVAVRTTR